VREVKKTGLLNNRKTNQMVEEHHSQVWVALNFLAGPSSDRVEIDDIAKLLISINTVDKLIYPINNLCLDHPSKVAWTADLVISSVLSLVFKEMATLDPQVAETPGTYIRVVSPQFHNVFSVHTDIAWLVDSYSSFELKAKCQNILNRVSDGELLD